MIWRIRVVPSRFPESEVVDEGKILRVQAGILIRIVPAEALATLRDKRVVEDDVTI